MTSGKGSTTRSILTSRLVRLVLGETVDAAVTAEVVGDAHVHGGVTVAAVLRAVEAAVDALRRGVSTEQVVGTDYAAISSTLLWNI